MKDLFILVADIEIRNMIQSLLQRLMDRGSVRRFTFDIKSDGRDAGCFRRGPDYIPAPKYSANPEGLYAHFMIAFDRDGSGVESWSPEDIASDVVDRACRRGWNQDDVACVVLIPEIESWVWTDTKHTADAMGWESLSRLKEWLATKKNHQLASNGKPIRPKEALEDAIKEAQKTNPKIRFADVHSTIAQSASLERCTDPSFLHFKETLLRWFPPAP